MLLHTCSQGRAVLATDLDGLIGDFPRHGLFFGENPHVVAVSVFCGREAPANVGGLECGAALAARFAPGEQCAAQHCRVSQRGGGLIEGCGTGPSAVMTLGDRTRPGSSQKLRAQT